MSANRGCWKWAAALPERQLADCVSFPDTLGHWRCIYPAVIDPIVTKDDGDLAYEPIYSLSV